MPTYVYGVTEGTPLEIGCNHCRETFEITQRMKDEPLRTCPECEAPIERRIQAPNLGNIGDKLKGPSSGDMEKAGFTQYKRAGKGHYEKTFGSGPADLSGN